MHSLLDHLALVNYKYHVAVFDAAQPVGNGDRGPVFS